MIHVRNIPGRATVEPAMEEAARLRRLAAQCRQIAASLSSEHSAETLRAMACEFDASATVAEKLPLIRAHPIRHKGRARGRDG